MSYETERLTSAFPVFSPYHALADLISDVGSAGVRAQTPLITCLKKALTSIANQDSAAAVRDLRMFQSLMQNLQEAPESTSQFRFQAQRVINAIN